MANADELFDRWRALLERGKFVTADVLCKGHPELRPELEERIQSYAVEELGSRLAADTDSDDSARDTSGDSRSPSDGADPRVTVIETMGLGPIADAPAVRPHVVPDPANSGGQSSVPAETLASSVVDGERESNLPTDDARIHSVGTFEGFRLLARGGLGEVFIAADLEFHRDIVLKFMRREFDDDDVTRAQFELEAEITARLEHPGIVPMYGIGRTSDGRVFQVMRYIRGESLEQRIADFHHRTGDDPGARNIEFRALLTRFASVCQTIAYAHTRGIVHRDMKPDNVMLGKYGETLVVDWGLAMPVERRQEDRATGEQTIKPASNGTESSDGMIAGTPCYMSPEQASGDEVGPRSDIYSLGAVLYKLLTGRLAFRGSKVSDVLRSVRSGVFEAPRVHDRSIPAPLEAIAVKAMSQEPRDRYTTALEIAKDIEAYLAGEPVSAHDEPWTTRVGRWLRRRERLARTLATLLLLAVVGSSVWATSSVLHRRNVIEHRLEFLGTEAHLHESLLEDGIDDLRDDVRMLARREIVRGVLLAANGAGIDDIARVSVAQIFEEFLDLNPDYLQVRLLGVDGHEIVRVDRHTRGGDPVWVTDLRDERTRPFFTETRRLQPGKVYLSPIEIDVDDGRRQWSHPVIRAATPLQGPEGTFQGVLVISLHFEYLAERVVRDAGKLDVLLVNGRGQILVHPVDDLEFAFERGLDLPIDAIYPVLGNFLRADDESISEPDITPVSVVVLVATSTEQDVTARVRAFSESIADDGTFEGVELRRSRYEADGTDREDNDARTFVAFVGTTPAQQSTLLQRARELGDDVRIHALPHRTGNHQAVHARKISTRDGDQHDLVLVMTVGY